MTVISFERYFAIVHQKNFTIRATLLVILAIWIVSFATSAPQLYEYSAKVVPDEYGNGTHLSCGSHDIPENFETIYASIILAISYVIPLLLISTNYFRLVAFLYRVSKINKGANPGQGGYTVNRDKVRVLRMAIVLTSVFTLLWLTYFVLFTIEVSTSPLLFIYTAVYDLHLGIGLQINIVSNMLPSKNLKCQKKRYLNFNEKNLTMLYRYQSNFPAIYCRFKSLLHVFRTLGLCD